MTALLAVRGQDAVNARASIDQLLRMPMVSSLIQSNGVPIQGVVVGDPTPFNQTAGTTLAVWVFVDVQTSAHAGLVAQRLREMLARPEIDGLIKGNIAGFQSMTIGDPAPAPTSR
jgi:hypothetical protein